VRWMVNKGAKYILILSRRGLVSSEGKALMEDLKSRSITIEVSICDIADKLTLKRVIKETGDKMPPIAGCVQAAMQLKVRSRLLNFLVAIVYSCLIFPPQDSLFDVMTYEDWTSAIRPKVHGSWNLHDNLPHNLDFFIMLSSLCGIVGQIGQSNYAAGNTYQDALAKFRVSNGQKAISIDLGTMVSDGFISENPEVAKAMLDSGLFTPLSQDDLFTLLDIYCGPIPILGPEQSQIALGLNTSAAVARGSLDSTLASPLFRTLRNATAVSHETTNSHSKTGSDTTGSRQQFVQAKTTTEAGSIVTQALVDMMTQSLSIRGTVDIWRPMLSYGVDSLVSVQLRTWFLQQFAANVSIFEIMGGASFAAIGMKVAACSELRVQDEVKGGNSAVVAEDVDL
jgi:hypothetical protein